MDIRNGIPPRPKPDPKANLPLPDLDKVAAEFHRMRVERWLKRGFHYMESKDVEGENMVQHWDRLSDRLKDVEREIIQVVYDSIREVEARRED